MASKHAFYRALPKEWFAMEEEMLQRLGVPAKGTPEREEWSHTQTEVWRPWMQAVSEHAWRFVEDGCQNCGQLTTCIKTTHRTYPTMSLCVECLNRGPAFYPTGWVMQDGTQYVRHSENCTLHSSYPTLSTSMTSEAASLLLPMLQPKTSSPSSTSSSVPPTTPATTRTSLRGMRLSRSAS